MDVGQPGDQFQATFFVSKSKGTGGVSLYGGLRPASQGAPCTVDVALFVLPGNRDTSIFLNPVYHCMIGLLANMELASTYRTSTAKTCAKEPTKPWNGFPSLFFFVGPNGPNQGLKTDPWNVFSFLECISVFNSPCESPSRPCPKEPPSLASLAPGAASDQGPLSGGDLGEALGGSGVALGRFGVAVRDFWCSGFPGSRL